MRHRAECTTAGQCGFVRQATNQTKGGKAQPGRPVLGCPIAGERYAVFGHRDRSLLGHAVYVTTVSGFFRFDLNDFRFADIVGLNTDVERGKAGHNDLVTGHTDNTT